MHSLQRSLSLFVRSLDERKGQREAQLCKTSFHVIPVSRATPFGLGARLEMDAVLILSSLSVSLTNFYPNPCLSLPNNLSLFAYLHFPAHCYSLLSWTPSRVHYVIFMWPSFHFLISDIHYSYPIPLLLTLGRFRQCVYCYVVLSATLPLLSVFKNQLPIQ